MATGQDTKFSCCSSCLEDGQNIVGRHYCVDCEMYFCTKCVKCHNKIPSLKSHQVNNVCSLDYKTTERGSDSVYSLRCTLHQGKTIDTYCKDHDEVGCGACAVVKHRLCTTVSTVIAAKGFNASPEFNSWKETLTEGIRKFKEEKNKRVDNLDCVGKQKQSFIEIVDKYEEKSIATIKAQAKHSRNDIRTTYEKYKTALDLDIEALDVVITTNSKYVDKLENIEEDEQLFIYAKTNKNASKDGEVLLRTMLTDWAKKAIRFSIEDTLDNHIFEMKSFIHLEEDRVDNEYRTTFQRNVNVRQSNDSNETYIRDMCLMDSGELLVADYGNTTLKRFDSDLRFIDEIELSGDPSAVCKIEEHEVAVRIWGSKVVQFISVGQQMLEVASFTLNGNGWGMAYDDSTGELFACEGNRLSVYDKTTGNKIRIYDEIVGGDNIFSACRQIAFSMNKQDLYVTDRNKGLIVLDKSGTLKLKVSLSGVEGTWLLCPLFGHIWLAGSFTSGVIVQVDKDGKQVGNLIDTTDGRRYTFSAVYDREHSRLIVGGYPSVMSVYKLSVNRY